MPNRCTVLLLKLPFAESRPYVHKTAYFMQQAHLHKRANECFKNQANGCRDSDFFFSILGSVNSGIMTMVEIYIMSIIESNKLFGRKSPERNGSATRNK